MTCLCKLYYGAQKPACNKFAACCQAEAATWNAHTAPAAPAGLTYDADALYQQFVDSFPVLSALDRMCWKCGQQIAIGFGRDDAIQQFSVTFRCHSAEYRQPFNFEDVVRGGQLRKSWAQAVLDNIRRAERS